MTREEINQAYRAIDYLIQIKERYENDIIKRNNECRYRIAELDDQIRWLRAELKRVSPTAADV